MAERSEPLKFSDEELARYKKNFTLFDKQATGAIPADELATVLRACGQNPTEAEIAILVEKVDINKNGLIEFEEFCELMSKTNKDPNEMEDLILKAFQTFDQDNSGTIDKDELLSTLTTMGDKVDEKMVMSMIEAAKSTTKNSPRLCSRIVHDHAQGIETGQHVERHCHFNISVIRRVGELFSDECRAPI